MEIQIKKPIRIVLSIVVLSVLMLVSAGLRTEINAYYKLEFKASQAKAGTGDWSAPSSKVSFNSPFSNQAVVSLEYTSKDNINLQKLQLFVSTPQNPENFVLAGETPVTGKLASGSFNYEFNAGSGNYSFYTKATDWFGNVELTKKNPDTVIRFDNSAPVITTTPEVDSTTKIAKLEGEIYEFTAQANEDVSFIVSLDYRIKRYENTDCTGKLLDLKTSENPPVEFALTTKPLGKELQENAKGTINLNDIDLGCYVIGIESKNSFNLVGSTKFKLVIVSPEELPNIDNQMTTPDAQAEKTNVEQSQPIETPTEQAPQSPDTVSPVPEENKSTAPAQSYTLEQGPRGRSIYIPDFKSNLTEEAH